MIEVAADFSSLPLHLSFFSCFLILLPSGSILLALAVSFFLALIDLHVFRVSSVLPHSLLASILILSVVCCPVLCIALWPSSFSDFESHARIGLPM